MVLWAGDGESVCWFCYLVCLCCVFMFLGMSMNWVYIILLNLEIVLFWFSKFITILRSCIMYEVQSYPT